MRRSTRDRTTSANRTAKAAAAYDRIHERAWRLALWITGDESSASGAVVAAFFDRSSEIDPDWADDIGLLRAVWHAAGSRASRGPATGDLAPRDREAVELVLIAGVATADVARALGRERDEVRLLVAARLADARTASLAGGE